MSSRSRRGAELFLRWNQGLRIPLRCMRATWLISACPVRGRNHPLGVEYGNTASFRTTKTSYWHDPIGVEHNGQPCFKMGKSTVEEQVRYVVLLVSSGL